MLLFLLPHRVSGNMLNKGQKGNKKPPGKVLPNWDTLGCVAKSGAVWVGVSYLCVLFSSSARDPTVQLRMIPLYNETSSLTLDEDKASSFQLWWREGDVRFMLKII